MKPSNRPFLVILKIYVAAALLVAALLSPAVLSFVPALLLVWFVAQWRWRISPFAEILTQFFTFFALALLFNRAFGLLAGLGISLPALWLVSYALEENAKTAAFNEGKSSRRPTRVLPGLLALVVATGVIAWFLGSFVLILSDALAGLFLIIILVYSWRHFPALPLNYEQAQIRCIAGKTESAQIPIESVTRAGGTFFLKSPFDWLKINPSVFSFEQDRWWLTTNLTPPLAGPSVIKLAGYAVDRWGLIETNFKIEPIILLVIPRASYAVWLAREYLSGTSVGALPVDSNTRLIKTIFGIGSATEYYGIRPYQPGDTLKHIDWKHSIKLNELISKEFRESHNRTAILLLNLTVGDENEADKLAYDLLITAVSLAREGVPTAVSAYNNESVVTTTTLLPGKELVLRSLQMVERINLISNPAKYLNPPDIVKLRTNLSRLRNAEGGAAAALAALLQFEYQSLSNGAKTHPCTLALAKVKTKSNQQCVVLSISQRNHDSEALDFNSYIFASKGNAIIQVKRPSKAKAPRRTIRV